MTIEQAIKLKTDPKWGLQNGLLSASEMVHLHRELSCVPNRRNVLEVGHYMGLSTCVIWGALEDGDTFLSIDAHIADAWVPKSDPEQYFRNIAGRMYPGITTLIMDSRSVQRLDGFNVVFYDGDHSEEQRRWTQMVIDSGTVETFIFDDRDFPVPVECCQMLRNAGWQDHSPGLERLPNDKMNPGTMTLGVFWR